MIRAVIFDCFGVLARDGWLPFREKYFGSNPDHLELAIASNKRVDAGLTSYDDFITEVAQLAELSEAEAMNEIENNPPDEQLFTFIQQELKPNYKIGMLSNAGANWLDEIFEPWQVDLFDEYVLSYQIGAIKPQAIMYETIAERLGVLPEECIFVDDQLRYVEGARDVGMTAILHESAAATISEIEDILRA
jgi:HAD superfamily hydrolase (TIGR01509 family)